MVILHPKKIRDMGAEEREKKLEKNPEKVVILHCVGREEVGYCSSVCCMYSMKFAHFIKKKLPNAEIFNIYSDVCVPDKNYQKFFRKVEGADTKMIFSPDIDGVKVSGNGSGMKVSYSGSGGSDETLDADMVILATAVVPDPEAEVLAEMVGLKLDHHGFFAVKDDVAGSVETSKEGLFVAGTAEGPKDIQMAVIQAEAVVGRVMSYLGRGN